MRAPIDRLRRALRVRADCARHRGTQALCPVCDSGFDHFKADWNRADALCWRCGAQERHRAQWLLLERRPELLGDARSLLHFSPEWCLRRRLRAQRRLRYVTTDIDPAGVDRALDITRLDLPDASFDAVICSHVLEHVADDAAAMRELRRVTAPSGFALVMVPLALDRAATYEDPSITDPAERERAFLQHDHVRLYALDVVDRLRAAGFAVEVVSMHAELGPAVARRYGLLASDLIFLCRRCDGARD